MGPPFITVRKGRRLEYDNNRASQDIINIMYRQVRSTHRVDRPAAAAIRTANRI